MKRSSLTSILSVAALAVITLFSGIKPAASDGSWYTTVSFSGQYDTSHQTPGTETSVNSQVQAYGITDSRDANESTGAYADLNGSFTITWNYTGGTPAQSSYLLAATYYANTSGTNAPGGVYIGGTYTAGGKTQTSQFTLTPTQDSNGDWHMSWTTPAMEATGLFQYLNQSSSATVGIGVTNFTIPFNEGSPPPD